LTNKGRSVIINSTKKFRKEKISENSKKRRLWSNG